MDIAILGGGFGLYGYLPALTQIPNVTVLMSVRYRDKLCVRDDIRHLYEKVNWIFDDDTLLESCDGVVIATHPSRQYYLIKKCLEYSNITHLFLEKPLAPTPNLARELFTLLKDSGKKFRMGYIFRYTQWGKELLSADVGISEIIWSFRAHHYDNNLLTWKREHDGGGGVLRFYGIHLIALMAERGYHQIVSSVLSSEAQNWTALFSGVGQPDCRLSISSNHDNNQFLIQKSNNEILCLSDPFANEKNREVNMDKRVPILIEGLQDLFGQEDQWPFWYQSTLELWNKAEVLSPN